MIDEWEVQIPKLSGDKKRRVFAYIPDDYEYTDDYYPVMYMFDGQNLFFDGTATYGTSWGMKKYLDKAQLPLIVIGIECNHEGHSRLSEYSPVDFEFKNGLKIKGRGKIYMDWLTKTFKPYIDERLRTLPEREYTAIGGSSMGGLMTVYALAKYGKYFSMGAALSPSLWVGGEETLPFIGEAKFHKKTLLYMDYGSKEFSRHCDQKKAYINACASLMDKGVYLTSSVIPDGTHCEASWEKRIPSFMKLFYGSDKV